MAYTTYINCALLLFLSNYTFADDQFLLDLAQNMEVMQRKIDQLEHSERNWKQTAEIFQKKIDKLEKSESQLKQSVRALIGATAQFRLQIEELTNGIQQCRELNKDKDSRLEVLEKVIIKDAEDSKESETNDADDDDNDNNNINQDDKMNVHNTNIAKRLSPPEHVAFSAYLDHVVGNLGKNQPVVYNRVLLHDQNAYNSASGIFTAPVSGVHLFSWAVTARKLTGEHEYDVWVKLVVDGAYKLSSVAESRNDAEDNQGSNTVILRLSKGDQVWTAHYGRFPDMFGDDTERSTSFTGVLLYV